MDTKREFPEGMVPLGESEFSFSCHPQVECFTRCCLGVDMILYPYDIIRLKNALGIDSEDFVRRHVFLEKGQNPFFPTVKLQLQGNETKSCPFLDTTGCTVYHDRPSACRMYPLERAVARDTRREMPEDYYFITHHPYCLGHREEHANTVRSWIRSQQLLEYNAMNDLWTEMDTLFATNPWKGEGAAGHKQQLAFMVCYNIDGFRRFAESQQLLRAFRLDKATRRRIGKEDGELLKFGFSWLRYVLTGRSSLVPK